MEATLQDEVNPIFSALLLIFSKYFRLTYFKKIGIVLWLSVSEVPVKQGFWAKC